MRVTAVQWDARDFGSLFDEVAASGADLVLLPELPFGPWLPDTPAVDGAAWHDAMARHEVWLHRLPDLGARVVVGTRPIEVSGHRFNEAFVWHSGRVHSWRTKTYLPDETGYWEASWYQRGPTVFEPMTTPLGRLGCLICTEMWFPEMWRDRAIDVLVVPRATPASSAEKWLAGGMTAAVISGALCVSSNHAGRYRHAQMGGPGWVIHPEEGQVLATTSADRPVVTVDVDMAGVAAAGTSYPRCVDHTARPRS